MRKKLLLAVLVISASAKAGAPVNIDMPVPSDEAWTRSIQALALQGVAITNNDRENGIIQGTGSFLGKPELFSCPRANGVAESQDFSISVVVRPSGIDTSTVELRVTGSERRYQNKKLLFITTGRVRGTTECQSTGAIENAFRSALAGA